MKTLLKTFAPAALLVLALSVCACSSTDMDAKRIAGTKWTATVYANYDQDATGTISLVFLKNNTVSYVSQDKEITACAFDWYFEGKILVLTEYQNGNEKYTSPIQYDTNAKNYYFAMDEYIFYYEE